MLYYCDVGISHAEVPGETTLCIYISGCINRCKNCHFPELQFAKYGDRLSFDIFEKLVELYSQYETCVCFMGEGNCSDDAKTELIRYASFANDIGYKTCLYSGRDTNIEEWMRAFDYVKVGSYNELLGPLSCRTTNQRLYRKANNHYIDITYVFWEESYDQIKEKEIV